MNYKKYVEPVATGIVIAVAANLTTRFIAAYTGWITLGLILGGIGYLAYRNWDDIKDFVEKHSDYIPLYG